jgi:hypothetical protein
MKFGMILKNRGILLEDTRGKESNGKESEPFSDTAGSLNAMELAF